MWLSWVKENSLEFITPFISLYMFLHHITFSLFHQWYEMFYLCLTKKQFSWIAYNNQTVIRASFSLFPLVKKGTLEGDMSQFLFCRIQRSHWNPSSFLCTSFYLVLLLETCFELFSMVVRYSMEKIQPFREINWSSSHIINQWKKKNSWRLKGEKTKKKKWNSKE